MVEIRQTRLRRDQEGTSDQVTKSLDRQEAGLRTRVRDLLAELRMWRCAGGATPAAADVSEQQVKELLCGEQLPWQPGAASGPSLSARLQYHGRMFHVAASEVERRREAVQSSIAQCMRLIAQLEHRIARIDHALAEQGVSGVDGAAGVAECSGARATGDESGGESCASDEVVEEEPVAGVGCHGSHAVIAAHAQSSWADGRAFLLQKEKTALARMLIACRTDLLPAVQKQRAAI